MKTPPKHPLLASALTLALSLCASALPAAQLSYHQGLPSPGPHDIHNLVGAARDRDNIGGDGLTDGDANDAHTYVSGLDRPHQGQTFTTGSNPAGYQLNAVHVRHAGYSSNTAATWWCAPVGGELIIRVTRPSAAGTFAFPLASETVLLTGREAGAPNAFFPLSVRANSANGTGLWLRLAFDKPVTLYPNTQYGFDLTAHGAEFFFELSGLRNAAAGGDAYPGGCAYDGSTTARADDTLNPLAGDRVFIAEMAPALEIARADDEVLLSWPRPARPVRQVEVFRGDRPEPGNRVRVAASAEPIETHLEKLPDAKKTYWYWMVLTRADGGIETSGPVSTRATEAWRP